MPYRSDLLDVRGVRTHLYQGGRGKPVLVLHPEFCADQWNPYHDQLSTSFRVLAPDHPGFGQSERPDWIESVDDLVFHYVDLLDLLGLESVSLIGTSLGGWIAAALAVAHPHRVERLVLAAAAGIRVDGVARFDVFLAPIEETLRHLFFDESRIPQLLPAASGPEVLLRAYRESTSLARLAWNPYFYDRKLQERLPRIKAPTLVLWGEQDTFLPPRHGEEYANSIPGAHLQTIACCGHLIPLEQPEQFVRHCTDFLLSPSAARTI